MVTITVMIRKFKLYDLHFLNSIIAVYFLVFTYCLIVLSYPSNGLLYKIAYFQDEYIWEKRETPVCAAKLPICTFTGSDFGSS